MEPKKLDDPVETVPDLGANILGEPPETAVLDPKILEESLGGAAGLAANILVVVPGAGGGGLGPKILDESVETGPGLVAKILVDPPVTAEVLGPKGLEAPVEDGAGLAAKRLVGAAGPDIAGIPNFWVAGVEVGVVDGRPRVVFGVGSTGVAASISSSLDSGAAG